VKFKLDENIGTRGLSLFSSAGHDAVTVADQDLAGIEDHRLYTVCATEDRALVTLDHDFGQVLRFPPEATKGIVVLELPSRPTPESLLERIREFLVVLPTQRLEGRLWIVESGRVRIHQSDADNED
jgi:hypothetical protein